MDGRIGGILTDFFGTIFEFIFRAPWTDIYDKIAENITRESDKKLFSPPNYIDFQVKIFGKIRDHHINIDLIDKILQKLEVIESNPRDRNLPEGNIERWEKIIDTLICTLSDHFERKTAKPPRALLLLGDMGSGKTSLLARFINTCYKKG